MNSTEQSETHIVVELAPARGVDDVSNDPDKLLARSNEAIRRSMESINGVARRLVQTIKEIEYTDRPDKVEVKFGLKLTADANALVVNAGTEAHFEVTLSWDSKSQSEN